MQKTLLAFFATAVATTPVFADQINVVVDIPPVHGIVQGVLGDNATITTLMDGGTDPHTYAMKPSHANALSNADLVVVIGASLTPSLVEKIPALAGNAKFIELEDVAGVHLIEYTDSHDDQRDHDAHDDDHNDDHDKHHDDHDTHHDGHDDHDHMGTDPHIWLDIDNASVWAHHVKQIASKMHPDLHNSLHDNLVRFEQSLSSIKEIISQIDAKPYAVSHDAFGYLEDAFGIDQPEAVTNGMGLRPSPRDMAKLREEIEHTKPACMIIDPNDHTALAYSLAEEYQIKTVVYSQLGEVIEGENAYLTLMNQAAKAFNTCFE